MNADQTITTVTGLRVKPFSLRREDVRLEDIARGLSNTARFAGQTKDFYSVAEHCVHLSRVVPENLAALALLHDAAEAYLGNVPASLRPALFVEFEEVSPADGGISGPVGPSSEHTGRVRSKGRFVPFDTVEEQALEVIFSAFGVYLPPALGRVLDWDLALRSYEATHLGVSSDFPCDIGMFQTMVFKTEIGCWPPLRAWRVFLDRAGELGIRLAV